MSFKWFNTLLKFSFLKESFLPTATLGCIFKLVWRIDPRRAKDILNLLLLCRAIDTILKAKNAISGSPN